MADRPEAAPRAGTVAAKVLCAGLVVAATVLCTGLVVAAPVPAQHASRVAAPLSPPASPAAPFAAADAGATGQPRQTNAGRQVLEWNREAAAAYESGDVLRALDLFMKAAARGDPSARYNVAVIRLREKSTRPPVEVAIRHLRASAAAGFAPAQFMLATMLDLGRQMPASQPEATRWYEQAAEQGHVDAQVAVATQYYLGRGVAEDAARAARWYARAAEAGDVGAQYIVASMFESGHGVGKNLREALDWYAMAARQGDVAAAGKAREVAERIAAERVD